MKTIKITFACLTVALAIFVVACKKSDNTTTTNPATTTDSDVSGASDNTLAENTSSDVVQIGAEATDNNTANLSNFRLSGPEAAQTLSACATVTPDSAAHTVTVSFNGDTCMDGRVRTGSITFNFSGSPVGAIHYRDPGFTFTATSNNYTVDSVQVNIINHTVLNTTASGFNSSTTDETWAITSQIQLIKPNGDTINWTANHFKTLLNTGDSTVYHGDSATSRHISWNLARVGITGSEYGSRSGGETFTTNITAQLVRDFGSCRIDGKVPFIIGRLTYTPSTKKYPRYIDYSAPDNGACDLWASVTINGIVYLVKLP